jgi:hypothetical protein
MSFGIKSYGDDGYINLHSDYSSLVYVGQMTVSVAAQRFVYTGDYSQGITSSRLDSNYDMGFVIQYQLAVDYTYIVPFYRPVFSGQEIAIMDVVKENGVWKVNVLFSGTSTQNPNLYVFAPLTELSGIVQNTYGLTVWDGGGNIVFTDTYRPLRVDDVVTITHPTSIRTGSKGYCGNDASCDVNYTPDQSSTYTGSVNNTSTKLYHAVTASYGGLAFKSDGGYTRSCGFLNLGSRKYAWGYQSWDSFRGTISHPHGTANHVASWEGDFCGKAYQLASGSCGYGGFLGALLAIAGVILAPVTGGASLGLIAVAGLAGFAIGNNVFAPSTPSLRSYTADQMYDSNNPVNMIMTDGDYYNIPAPSGSSGSSGGTYTGGYTFSLDGAGVGYYMFTDSSTGQGFIWWGGNLVASALPSGTTSYTAADGYTYYRGTTLELTIDGSAFGSGLINYYGVGRAA